MSEKVKEKEEKTKVPFLLRYSTDFIKLCLFIVAAYCICNVAFVTFDAFGQIKRLKNMPDVATIVERDSNFAQDRSFSLKESGFNEEDIAKIEVNPKKYVYACFIGDIANIVIYILAITICDLERRTIKRIFSNKLFSDEMLENISAIMKFIVLNMIISVIFLIIIALLNTAALYNFDVNLGFDLEGLIFLMFVYYILNEAKKNRAK